MLSKEKFEDTFNKKVVSKKELEEFKKSPINRTEPKCRAQFDELLKWLDSNKYHIPENASEYYDSTHQWEISRNYFIDKTTKKINELLDRGSSNKIPLDCFEQFGEDLDGCSRASNQGCAGCAHIKE